MERLVEELQKPDQGPTPPQQYVPTASEAAKASASNASPLATTSSNNPSPLSRRKASSASPSSGNPDNYPSPPSATSSASTGARPYYIGAPDESTIIAAGT